MLLDTYEMQPRWEYEVVIISPVSKADLLSPVNQGSFVDWFWCYDGYWQPWSAFIRQSREAINLEQM